MSKQTSEENKKGKKKLIKDEQLQMKFDCLDDYINFHLVFCHDRAKNTNKFSKTASFCQKKF